MQKKASFFLIVVFWLSSLFQPVYGQNNTAGQPGEFLRYGVGARALGLGQTFTGLADDASAVYWNPAGLMNAGRKQFTSMYTNLFYDSRYTYMAVALPRTLVGGDNAVGLGWVNLNMADFDGRDSDNIPRGSFDYYEQAFMLSGARELVSSWGILNYGLNVKIINQAFPGYTGGSAQGWGFGADVGATFRPINAPLFKLIPLRRLMPLQLGLALQNVIAPSLGFGDGEKDKYPLVVRWGASYALLLADWRFNLLYDQEFFTGRSMGHFVGAEAEMPSPFTGATPRLRAGWNSRSGAPSFGGGLELNYLSSAVLHVDFAYAIKPNDFLENDFRLFLSIDFGQPYNAAWFAARAETADLERRKKADHLHVISRFPNDNVNESAELLGSVYDTSNVVRYYRLIGGLRLANQYFMHAKEYLRENRPADAKQEANNAIAEYALALQNTPGGLTDLDLLNYGECLIMTGQYAAASAVLPNVKTPSLRLSYLRGVSYKFQQNWPAAIEQFNQAVAAREADVHSMKALSLFGLGEALQETQAYDAAIEKFTTVTDLYYANLDANYPRYPSYAENTDDNIHNIADDAQFLIGVCYEAQGNQPSALNAFAKINRFYPFSSRLADANAKVETLLKNP